MPRSSRLNLPQFMADMVEIAEQAIASRLKVGRDDARDLALEIAASTCERNAKSEIYIPEGSAIELQRRNERIWLEYTADNLQGCDAGKYTGARLQFMAKLYDISLQHIYSIVREGRGAPRADLPGESTRVVVPYAVERAQAGAQFSPAQLAELNRMHDDTVQRITHVIRTQATTPAAVPGECPAASPASTDLASE